MGDYGSGEAKRRRDHRLRMHWRHEQLTLQMALAAALHHSRDVGPVSYNAPRSQRTARQGSGGASSTTPQPELFSLYEEEPGGARPGSVTDPAPHVRVERHVVEHRIEACPFVQILNAPVPQGGNQLVEAFRHLDLHSPSRLPKCPRSRLHAVVVAGAGFPWCRRRNSWWKCRNSCRLPFSSSSRSLTLLDVLKGFSLDRIILWCGSRSLTLQFRLVVVEFPEVFKALSLDMWSRPLTFQLHAVVSGVFKVFSQNTVQQ